MLPTRSSARAQSSTLHETSNRHCGWLTILPLRPGSPTCGSRAGSAEIVCEKLAQRGVPFIFYTGALPQLPLRFAGAPLILKPAAAPIIIGALRYALSAEPLDIVAPREADRDPVSAIRDGEERIERVHALIARLDALGSDTSVAQRLLASICTAVETMRYSANICAAPPWSSESPLNRRRP